MTTSTAKQVKGDFPASYRLNLIHGQAIKKFYGKLDNDAYRIVVQRFIEGENDFATVDIVRGDRPDRPVWSSGDCFHRTHPDNFEEKVRELINAGERWLGAKDYVQWIYAYACEGATEMREVGYIEELGLDLWWLFECKNCDDKGIEHRVDYCIDKETGDDKIQCMACKAFWTAHPTKKIPANRRKLQKKK